VKSTEGISKHPNAPADALAALRIPDGRGFSRDKEDSFWGIRDKEKGEQSHASTLSPANDSGIILPLSGWIISRMWSDRHTHMCTKRDAQKDKEISCYNYR
jgi:hypothetical protein